MMRVYLPCYIIDGDIHDKNTKWEEMDKTWRKDWVCESYKQFRFLQERPRTFEKWEYWVEKEIWRYDGT